MKTKSFLFLLLVLFIPLVQAQNLKETIITTISVPEYKTQTYSFKYDRVSGNWLYSTYDTIQAKNIILSSWGAIPSEGYVFVNNAFFDEQGNFYYVVDNSSYESGKMEYALMKNNNVILIAKYIGDNWAIRDGVIYFQSSDDVYSYLTRYNIKTGELSKSKPYETIDFVYYPSTVYTEREAYSFPGFTKSGEVYYVASQDNKSFLVVGDREYKKYVDIDKFSLKFDALDNPVYIAKSKGLLYSTKGNTFVVHGDKEYKVFDYINSSILISENNIPLYVGQDSIGEYRYRSHLMAGNKELDVVDGDIGNLKLSPEGKLAYVVSIEKKITADSSGSESYLVYDGKKSQKYVYIFDYDFYDGKVVMSAQVNDKTVLVSEGKVLSDKFDYISTFKYFNSVLSYTGINYGDYNKNIPDKNYVVIGNKKMGPYDGLPFMSFDDEFNFAYESPSLYAFLTTRNLYTDGNYSGSKFTIVSSNWLSPEFDYVEKVLIASGKIIYIAGVGDFTEGTEQYSVYVDNQLVASGYNSIGESWVTDNKFSFVATKGNTFYYVEIEL